MKSLDTPCRVCGKESEPLFSELVLKKYQVQYYQCTSCEYVQTENPYWLDEAYGEAIKYSDVGLLNRNLICMKKTLSWLYLFNNPKGRFLDYAGGLGIFTRLMRDQGIDFYHNDPYAENIFAHKHSAELQGQFEAIAMFECFEHWVEPTKEIELLFKHTNTLIFSTGVVGKNPSPSWDYFGFPHGQHVGIASRKAIEYLAKKLDKQYYHDGFFHILTDKKNSALKLWGWRKMGQSILFMFLRRRQRTLLYQDVKKYQ